MRVNQDVNAGLRQHQSAGRHLGAVDVKTYTILRPADTHSRPATCAEVGCPRRAAGFVITADQAPAGGRASCAEGHPLDGGGPCPTCAAVAREVLRTARPTTAALSAAVAARVRRYMVHRDPTGVTVWTFPPGQECYEAHTVQLDRPALHLVRGGDWRGNPRGTPTVTHRHGANWVEDFALHQDKIADEVRKG